VTPESASTPAPAAKPIRDTIVVDLGKKAKKSVSKLRKGRGPLMEDVNQVINELKTNGTITGAAQPVVIIVTERDDSGLPFFGFLTGK
jgi:hypothetical protein